jgi:hypothetical protein
MASWPHDRFNIPGSPAISSLFKYADDDVVAIPDSQQKSALDIAQTAILTPNKNYNPLSEEGGIKPNAAPTPNVAGGTTKQLAGASGDIQAFLSQCLSEASQGSWRETGQGGKTPNPNIVGIWPYIGVTKNPPTGAWATDQTAWCMGFVQFVLKNCGYKYYTTAGASQIADPKCGTTLVTSNIDEVATKGQPGDIFLYGRSGGSGHVCYLYQMETPSGGFVPWSKVGGNQSPKGQHSDDDGDVTKSRPSMNYAKANFKGLYRPSK